MGVQAPAIAPEIYMVINNILFVIYADWIQQ